MKHYAQHTLILHAAESYENGICAINKHNARRQICINQSGTQHSAAR
jgi:hypothetical protein